MLNQILYIFLKKNVPPTYHQHFKVQCVFLNLSVVSRKKNIFSCPIFPLPHLLFYLYSFKQKVLFPIIFLSYDYHVIVVILIF